jgi:GNAT superfamily N-acetyltransferase
MKDAPELARVHVESWLGAYRGLLPDDVLDGLSVTRRTEQWRRWLEPGGERPLTLVAEAERPLGFASLAIPSLDDGEGEGVGEIPALYVEPAAWGRGVGAVLLDAAVEAMREMGCREGILWMLEGNDRAGAFYDRHRWRRDGGRRASQHYPDVNYRDLEEPLVEVRFRRDL